LKIDFPEVCLVLSALGEPLVDATVKLFFIAASGKRLKNDSRRSQVLFFCL